MRLLLLAFVLSVIGVAPAGAVATLTQHTPAPSRLPTAMAAPPWAQIVTDTVVPPLTRAEERELRRLEREDLRARRHRGEVPPYRGGRDYEGGRGGPNGLAIAALPAGVAGVTAFFVGIGLWTPGPLIALSVAAFACALVFGAIGLRRAKRQGRRHRGLAIAGMVLGIVGTAFYAFLLALVLSWSL